MAPQAFAGKHLNKVEYPATQYGHKASVRNVAVLGTNIGQKGPFQPERDGEWLLNVSLKVVVL